MQKLFSWRCSVIQSQTWNQKPSLLTQLSSMNLLFVASFKSHSPSNAEIDDPPFSRVSAQTPKRRSKPRNTTQKNKTNKLTDNSSSETTNELAMKSELSFDFMYSYSETSSNVKPIGFREPTRFSPFGPGRLDRKWTGTCAPANLKVDSATGGDRERVLGEPLTEQEISNLVEKYRHSNCSRQINLGKGGVTHNMLEDIHSHWKRAEAIRIKCLGVPTLDMDNISFHLEDKCGGKIIYRHINILLLYRGRNYDSITRPQIPLMLWKPRAPIYPRLVSNITDGLDFEQTKEMRNRGLNSPPLMKLSRNGVYVNVVERVKSAFENEEVVRLDCTYVGTSDCKKIGVKLRDLVPCVPILFKDEQIILWRGKQKEQMQQPLIMNEI